jgi:opacity protein-like surface antigen
MMLIRLLTSVLILGGINAVAQSAAAAVYPVAGKWAYERSASQADACKTGPFMEFKGDRRFDTGSSAPDYKNLTLSKSGSALYEGVDLFFTGAVRGKVAYTLRLADADHIEMRFTMGGKVVKLRRCP